MKIAIVSDSHDNLKNLRKLLSFLKRERINILIHCGDLCKRETLEEMLTNFEGKIYFALGNADLKEELLEFKNNQKIQFFEDFGELRVDNFKIGFCHYFNLAKKNFQTKKYNFVFYGDTHHPWIEEKEGLFLVNPGNLANLYYLATFALLETKTKKIELKVLEEIKESS